MTPLPPRTREEFLPHSSFITNISSDLHTPQSTYRIPRMLIYWKLWVLDSGHCLGLDFRLFRFPTLLYSEKLHQNGNTSPQNKQQTNRCKMIFRWTHFSFENKQHHLFSLERWNARFYWYIVERCCHTRNKFLCWLKLIRPDNYSDSHGAASQAGRQNMQQHNSIHGVSHAYLHTLCHC